MNNQAPEITVVIPFHNEEGALEPLLGSLAAALASLPCECEVLMVDDASADGSAALVREFSRAHPAFRLLQLSRRGGQTGAFARAFAEARGDYIIRMDADGQDDPQDLALFHTRIEAGAELIMGLRHRRRHRRLFRVASSLYDLLILILFDSPLHANTGSFVAFKTRLVRDIPWRKNDHRYLPMIAMRRGARNVSEVLVRHGERQFGQSKYNPYRKILLGFPELMFFLLRLLSGVYDLREEREPGAGGNRGA